MTPAASRAIITMMCGVMVGLLGAVANQKRLAAQATDRPSDPAAHAVYAAALKLRFSSDEKALTTLTLLQQTRAVLPVVCAVEENVPQDWRPVLDDYKAENATPRPFPQKLDLGLAYSLVTLTALRTQMLAAGYDLKSTGWQSPGAEVFARLPGGMLVTLSAVGFNADRTRAMVTVQTNCFPFLEAAAEFRPCHEGRQLLMEREGGGWVPARNIEACRWIA